MWNSLIFYHWYLIPYSVSVSVSVSMIPFPFPDSGFHVLVLPIWEGDAQNARDLEMGMPKTWGCPKRCDTAKHLKFDSSYSNYGMRGLSCWHVITRTQLSSFLFPLKPCHANFKEQGWSLLNRAKLRNVESLSSEDLPELFYSFFLIAREKKSRLPSVWTT